MSNDKKDPDLPRHSEPQPGASVLLRSNGEGDVTLSFSDGSEPLTMNRRDFMRVSGAAAATAAMASVACREEVRHIVPYVDRPEDVRIGNFSHYASVCDACPSQCGIIVKSRAGRPVKLEGNPHHPVSQGGLCARGQASYIDLYDPDRLRHPAGPDGQARSWDDVDEEIRQRVEGLRNGDGLRILTGARTGPATTGLINQIVDDLPNAAHYVYEPLADEAVTAANQAAYGSAHVPRYRFDEANFIVSLGSDFLGTWLSPVEFTRQFASGRDFFAAEEEYNQALEQFVHDEIRAEHGDVSDEEFQRLVDQRLSDPALDDDFQYDYDPTMNRFVAFEPSLTLTGINADDRYRVRPDHLTYVALAIAHELFENHSPGGVPAAAVQGALAPFDVESVADRLGDTVDADDLRQVAAELADHAGQSIVIAGGIASASVDGIALESAVNLINAALENDGRTIDRSLPSYQSPGGATELQALIDEIEAGDVEVLIIDETNPVYTSPANLDFAAALEQVPYVISTAKRLDETARHADVVATGCHYLESWGDSNPRADVFAVRQPVILPIFETRAFEDSLLHWFGDEEQAPGLAAYLEGPDEPNPIGDRHGRGRPYDPGPFHRYLRDYWEREIYANFNALASFDHFWEQVLRDGHIIDADRAVAAPNFNVSQAAELLPSDLPQAADVGLGDLSNKVVQLFPTIPMYDGRHANNGHLQELPDPISKHTWGSFAMVGYRTFEAAGLQSGQILEVSTEGGDSLRFPVIAMPGMHEDVIALPLGYGRESVGVVGDDVGHNAFLLAEATDEGTLYTGLSADIRDTGDVETLSVIQGAGVVDVERHRILATANLQEYTDDQRAGVYRTPYEEAGYRPPSLWPDHDFGDLKWGMSIDMTKCTGCSACTIACQEENNIPVVGRQGILEGRQMYWLRIDRYYRLPEEAVRARDGLLGDPMYEDEPYLAFGEFLDEPRVVMQPMLCQHCDKAPCESVCPVVATMQSNDGLNQMAYNRCVGTRYCANNCPYKVRRFNWFNYAENREDSFFARFYPEMKEHGRFNQTEPLQLALNPDVTVRSRGVMEKCTFCVQRIRRGKWKIMEEGRRTFHDGEVVTACQQSCPADAIEFGNLLDDDHKVARIHKRKRAMFALADLDTRPGVAYLTRIWNTDEELA